MNMVPIMGITKGVISDSITDATDVVAVTILYLYVAPRENVSIFYGAYARSKGEWVCIVDCPTFFLQGRQLLWRPVCFSAHQVPSERESTVIGKKGSKFFPFRVDPFSEMFAF